MKKTAPEVKGITTARTHLQEALKNISPVASGLARTEDKVKARDGIVYQLKEAQKALQSVDEGGATEAKATIETALSGIPRIIPATEKERESRVNSGGGVYRYGYGYTYGRRNTVVSGPTSPTINWDTRKTQGDIEKAIKQLKP